VSAKDAKDAKEAKEVMRAISTNIRVSQVPSKRLSALLAFIWLFLASFASFADKDLLFRFEET
jgi:hypothetical protein